VQPSSVQSQGKGKNPHSRWEQGRQQGRLGEVGSHPAQRAQRGAPSSPLPTACGSGISGQRRDTAVLLELAEH
jgi:hypothetical protein